MKISKYEKSAKLIEIVKKCKLMELNDDAIINTIEYDTGKKISKSELVSLVEIARREVREQQIEVDVHMEHMVKIGLYTDAMNQHEMLTNIERIIYSEIMQEAVSTDKNRNMILAMSNTLTKVFATKNTLITNIAFLTKTRAIWEQGVNNNPNNNDPLKVSSGTEKTAIMIKDQKQNVEKLIEEALDPKELEANRVA